MPCLGSTSADVDCDDSFDFPRTVEAIGPFEDVFVGAVVAGDKEEGGVSGEVGENVRGGSGFCECCGFGDDHEFCLDGVDGRGAGIVDVVCAFSCLTVKTVRGSKGKWRDTAPHHVGQHLHSGKSRTFLSPQSEINGRDCKGTCQ